MPQPRTTQTAGPQTLAAKRPLSTRETVWAIMVASSGNLIEWFDFYVYAFFSVYFAEQFFTGTGQTGAFMLAAGVFFIGFLMRPIGGYVFGRIADRAGRKHAMVISILMMGFGSLLLALLPTAAAVGALAPVLLLIVRCIQGIAVGGEYGSTATYMSEIAQPGRRGFYSSFQYVTLVGGQLLASLLAVVMTHVLGEPQITGGWWRLPFVIGAVGSLVALWLRSGLTETTSASDRQHAGSGTFKAVLRHRRSFWVVLGITCVGSLTFYVFTTYMQKYLINTAGFSKGVVAEAMTVCLLVFMLLQPVSGAISDRIGRRNSMLIFAVGMVLLPVPLLNAIGAQTSIVSAGLLIMAAMVVLSFYTSISGVVKAETFPAYIRGLGVGFTYAIGNSLFGGSAEYIALAMKEHGIGAWFPWYVVSIAILGLIAVWFMLDDRKHSTIDHPTSSGYNQRGDSANERPPRAGHSSGGQPEVIG
jgi:MHS family alpha-ketoglutarate permease-like MFS transporter